MSTKKNIVACPRNILVHIQLQLWLLIWQFPACHRRVKASISTQEGILFQGRWIRSWLMTDCLVWISSSEICFSWSSRHVHRIFCQGNLQTIIFANIEITKKKHKQHHSTTQLLHLTPPKLVSKTNMSGSTDLLLHRAICRIQGIKSLVRWLTLTTLKLDAWKMTCPMVPSFQGTFVNCFEGVTVLFCWNLSAILLKHCKTKTRQ